MVKLSHAAFLSLSVSALLVALPVTGAETAHRYALVIGNGDYKAGPLAASGNDVALLARALQEDGFEVTAARDLDQATLKRSLQDFLAKLSKAGPESTAFVYLGGYGAQFQGENYFLPVDAKVVQATDLPFQGVKVSEFQHALAAQPLKARLLVLDGAHALPFAKNADLAPGLAYLEPEAGTLVALNASPGFVAPETTGINSPYSAALGAALAQPNLSADELFKQVRLKVSEATKAAQVPWHLTKLEPAFQLGPLAGQSAAAALPEPAKTAEPAKTVDAIKPAEPAKTADAAPAPLRDVTPIKPLKADAAKPADSAREITTRETPAKDTAAQEDAARQAAKLEAAKLEAAKRDAAREAAAKREAARRDTARLEAAQRKHAERKYAEQQQAREESLAWRQADALDTSRAYRLYLERFPHGKHAADARQSLNELAQIDRSTSLRASGEEQDVPLYRSSPPVYAAPPAYRQRILPAPAYGQLYDDYGDPIPLPPRGVYGRHRYVEAEDPAYAPPMLRRFFDDVWR